MTEAMGPQKIPGRQRGVTLLEVLIAILVLSFGLLGMLGLITNSLKITSSSQYRTIAAQQLAAMAEMINASPSLIGSYAPPLPPGNTLDYAHCLGSAGANCTSAPQIDYALWVANVESLLPSGAGIVCLDNSSANLNSINCSGTGRPTVKICWNESSRIAISGGSTGAADTCLSTQL